ncbi:hypothetical protein ACFC09_34760 [Streptomyces sp. NPDC056161]|uniref:hypothetical protein n=1 Tax=Streptomyces sp. NPDC056161 TaxID=3345732 RepID=UPI0035D8E765
MHGQVRSTRETGERGVVKTDYRYSHDPSNLAHVSTDRLLDAFTEILTQCRHVLRPGGTVVVTTRPWRERGELIGLPAAVLAAGQAAGLTPTERCATHLAGIRAGRLMTRPSFFQMKNVRDARRQGIPLASSSTRTYSSSPARDNPPHPLRRRHPAGTHRRARPEPPRRRPVPGPSAPAPAPGGAAVQRLNGTVHAVDDGWRTDLSRDEVAIVLASRNHIVSRNSCGLQPRGARLPTTVTMRFRLVEAFDMGVFQLYTASRYAVQPIRAPQADLARQRADRNVVCRLRLVTVEHNYRNGVVSRYRFPAVQIVSEGGLEPLAESR